MSTNAIPTNDSKTAGSVIPGSAPDESRVEQSASVTEGSTDQNQEASDASEDVEDGTDAETQLGEDGRPKKSGGFKKKINKLIKQRADAQRELEYWKSTALKSQTPQEPLGKDQSKSVDPEAKPRADGFDTHEAYVEALADWKYDQRKKADDVKQKETQMKTEFQTSVGAFQSKVKEFQKAQKDFQEVLEDVDDIKMSIGVQEALLSSDLGPQVMYELAKNREEYERINGLNPVRAAYELGKIEARVAGPSSKDESTKQSKAPAPIKPVGGMGGGGVKKNILDPNIPFADYVQLRREQSKRKA